MIFGNTERSESVVCPCDEARIIVGCCLVTVNVRVMTVVVAVEVSFKGSLSRGSVFGMIELAEDFNERSRSAFLMESSDSKSENTKTGIMFNIGLDYLNK